MGPQELSDIADTYAPDPDSVNWSRGATLGDSGPTASSVGSYATSFQQSLVNIYSETTFICPSYWVASTFGQAEKGGDAWHYQFSVPPAEHGVDKNAWQADNIVSPGAGTLTSSFRLGVQLIWGSFVMNNDPTMSNATISKVAGSDGTNGDFVAASSENWPRWSGGTNGSAMLNLNMTGGVETAVGVGMFGTSFNVMQYANPGLSAAWRVVDGYNWEGKRGVRCDSWQGVGPTVPE